MIRARFTVPFFFAVLTLASASAEDLSEQNENLDLDEIFKQLDLTLRERNDVQEVVEQFQEDRVRADQALQELSETLPPQEEVSATTVYSDIVLESRLNRVLDSHQVKQIMTYLEEQRRQRSQLQGAE